MNTKEKSFDQKRRSFLKLSGLLGVGVVSAAVLPGQKAEAFLFGKNEYKVTKTSHVMGTFVTMTAIHPSRDEAEEAIGLAFQEIDRLNKMLTHYENSSVIGTFNKKDKLDNVPAEVLELVFRSLYYYNVTDGAFDITVKPLVDLYKNSFAANHEPADGEIKRTLKRVGSEKLRYEGGALLFTDSDMAITLDGIAKGYIVDKASAVLARNGVTNHLINAGGDIKTSGTTEKGKAWTVAVQDPGKKREYPDIITMNDGAIATSGNYEIYYDEEKLFHHIVNSRTGHSPHFSNSVTVIAPTVMDADALATSVFVMEPKAGIRFIETQPATECFIVDKNDKINCSTGWQL